MLGAPDGWSFRSTPCPSSVAHACRVLAGPQLRRTATLAASDDPLAQRVFIIDSTVVMWSGHIGSYADQVPLLGKYLRKDLVNWGTLG